MKHLLLFLFVLSRASGQQTPAAVNFTFASALERARQYSGQALTANFVALVAREDAVQAKAALLPTATALSQYIYTQPNGTDTGVFVAANGPREYLGQGVAHADIYAPVKRADYRRAVAAEAVARARADIAGRGLIATVAQNYYGMVGAQRRIGYAEVALTDAENFADITVKQGAAGEVSRADVIKAQLQAEQRRIELQNARTELEKTRIGFSVMLFPNYTQAFTVTDDLETVSPVLPFADIQAMASRNNPEIRAAQATVEQQTHEKTAARAGLLPTFSVDYLYGIDANRVAWQTPEGFRNVGSQVLGQLSIPIWNWGATRSKIRQADLRVQLARAELSLAQRQLLANLNAYYVEASTAASLLTSLRRAVELAAESLRLTLLRYQAGEATALEVVDAQNALVQTRNALTDGLIRYRLSISNLQILTGVF